MTTVKFLDLSSDSNLRFTRSWFLFSKSNRERLKLNIRLKFLGIEC